MLKIYEAPESTGPWSLIETITPVGSQGSYLTSYTTANAISLTDWFAIEWVDSKGAVVPMSPPIQGGTTTLVAKLVQRMLLRDPSLDENIAAQEAEASISLYYNVEDPYTVDSSVSPAILSGLTLLALSRSYLFVTVTQTGTQNVQKFTAGLVSIDSGSSAASSSSRKLADLKAMMDLANTMLGRNFSFIAQLEEIEVGGGFSQIVARDISRSIIEVQ
jgi:hypothetical protein